MKDRIGQVQKVVKTRNKFEERTRLHLKRKKINFDYEVSKISYTITGSYIPDFTIVNSDGTVWFLECKGHFRAADKRKLAAVKCCNSSLDIRILFYRRVEQNIRWAEKHGFPWAIATIPTEWLQ
jgi:hypothetical protein